jgi:hypothetical protein
LRPAYEFHRRFLQHLQQRKKASRWVLKASAHLFALPTLLSICPDARFVQTHREPLEAIASVSSLITILRRVIEFSRKTFEVHRRIGAEHPSFLRSSITSASTPMGPKSNMLNRYMSPINPCEDDGLFGVGKVGRQS